MVKVLQKRFDELLVQIDGIEATKDTRYSRSREYYDHVDSEKLLTWRVKARNLLANACGRKGEHFIAFADAEKPESFDDDYKLMRRVRAVFMAAKEDFEGGYLVSMRNLIQAELAGTELGQAQELYGSGYYTAAAVIAGSVLETTLRTLCDRANIGHGKLDKMNADLAKAGTYNSLVQKRVTSLAAIRNSAAHGKASEYTSADVEMMIKDVERFLADALK